MVYTGKMKTILVAVDLSPISSQVVEAACDFAKPLDAKIFLLHVVSPVSSCVPIGSSMDVASIPLPPSEEEIEETRKALEKLAAPFKKEGLTVKSIVKIAPPVEEIKEQMEAHRAGLLIVGSHGHGGLYHLFNGSVVTALLKYATKPVLVVPVKGK